MVMDLRLRPVSSWSSALGNGVLGPGTGWWSVLPFSVTAQVSVKVNGEVGWELVPGNCIAPL